MLHNIRKTLPYIIFSVLFSVLFSITFLDSFYSFCEEKKMNESINKANTNNKMENVDANASSVYQNTVDGISYVMDYCYNNPVYATLGAVVLCGSFIGLYYFFTSVGVVKSTALGVSSATLGSTSSSTSTPVVDENAISAIGETIGEKIINKVMKTLSEEEASKKAVSVNHQTTDFDGLVSDFQNFMVDVSRCLVDSAEKTLSIDSPVITFSKAIETSVSTSTDLIVYNHNFALGLLKVTQFAVHNPSLVLSVGYLSASCIHSLSSDFGSRKIFPFSSKMNSSKIMADFIITKAVNPFFFKGVNINNSDIVLKDSIAIKTKEPNSVVTEVVDDLISKVEIKNVVNQVVDDLVSKVELKDVVPTMDNALYLVADLNFPIIDIAGGPFEMDFRLEKVREISHKIGITNDNKLYIKKTFRRSLLEQYKSYPDFYNAFVESVNSVDLSLPENKASFVYHKDEEITKQNIIIFLHLSENLSCATGPYLHLIPEDLRNIMFKEVGDEDSFRGLYDSKYDPFLEYLQESSTKIFSSKSIK